MNAQLVGWKIVIGMYGWVWVGQVEQIGDELVVHDAQCVRRWGTRHGLAEIACNGPTAETVLDAPSTLRVHRLAVVGLYDVSPYAVERLQAALNSAQETLWRERGADTTEKPAE